MRGKLKRRLRTMLIATAVVVPAALVFHLVFFGVIAPRLKATQQQRTATALLVLAEVPPTGLQQLSDPPRGAFGARFGIWSVPLSAQEAPFFDARRFAQLQGYDRARALEELTSNLAKPPTHGLIDAPVWRGSLRLARGTFCASTACRVTAAHIGDQLFFEVAAN